MTVRWAMQGMERVGTHLNTALQRLGQVRLGRHILTSKMINLHTVHKARKSGGRIEKENG